MAKYLTILASMIFVLVITTKAGNWYATDADSCIKCYGNGHVHCIREGFDDSVCCTGDTTASIN
jgi:hypothetical protein